MSPPSWLASLTFVAKLPDEPVQPLGRRRLDFTLLSDDEFEVFCFLVVQIEFPNARRLRAPDNGADAILSAADGTPERCWQFKRYSGSISWPKCKESLDAAVNAYAMRHYTFCFARDLTGSQQRLFGEHLVGRHSGVEIDYTGNSDLLGRLLATDQGRRIERHFYPDSSINMETVIAAIRAGGALGDGADIVERLSAIAGHLARHDPLYSVTTGSREQSLPPGPLHPSTVIALETSDGSTVQRFEAIPRNPAMDAALLPGGNLTFEENDEGHAAWEAYLRAFSTGRQTTLSSGVRVELTGLPRLFEEIAGQPAELAEVVIGPGAPVLWRTRVDVSSDLGDESVEINLRRVEPIVGAEATFEGSSGPFELTCSFMRTAAGGAGSMSWTYSAMPDASLSETAEALALVEAMHGSGTLTLADRDEVRPSLPFTLTSRPVPQELRARSLFIDAMLQIERWVGKPLRIPTEITPEFARQVGDAAAVIKLRRGRFTVGGFDLDVDEEGRKLLDGKGPLMLDLPWTLEQDGQEFRLGTLRGVLTDWTIPEAKRLDGVEPASTRVRIEPAVGAENIEFQLHRADAQDATDEDTSPGAD